MPIQAGVVVPAAGRHPRWRRSVSTKVDTYQGWAMACRSTKVDTYQSGAMAGRFRRLRSCRPLAGIRDGVKQKLLSDL